MECYKPLVVTRLVITGMSCNHCTRSVGDALRGVPGVERVEVRLPDTAEVVHEDRTELPALIVAVQSAGYEARLNEEGRA
jgi:copper chaperone CopZ